tara:strand:- start:182500 stop:182628 length:129 start_codon:yes stop_codon:yes gene_type:complete
MTPSLKLHSEMADDQMTASKRSGSKYQQREIRLSFASLLILV